VVDPGSGGPKPINIAIHIQSIKGAVAIQIRHNANVGPAIYNYTAYCSVSFIGCKLRSSPSNSCFVVSFFIQSETFVLESGVFFSLTTRKLNLTRLLESISHLTLL